MRVPAPSRPRHSSMTTPRSRSISRRSSVMPPAKSLSASKPRVERAGAIGRHVEHVDRLVEARVGVDVRAEPRADRLEIRDQLARLEVRRAVERHVLEHVREAALIVGLVDRAGLDREPQHRRGSSGRALWRMKIGQAVRQRAGADRRVERQRRDEILRRRRRRRTTAPAARHQRRRYAARMRLKIRRLDSTVPLPGYGTDEAAGFDLAAAHDVDDRAAARSRSSGPASSSRCRPDTSWRFSPEAARRSSADCWSPTASASSIPTIPARTTK